MLRFLISVQLRHRNLYSGGTKFNQSNVIEKCFYSMECIFSLTRWALLKESSTSAATKEVDAHGGESVLSLLFMTMDHAWDSLKKNWRLKLALKYGGYQRVEHLKHLISYIRSMMETRKFGK